MTNSTSPSLSPSPSISFPFSFFSSLPYESEYWLVIFAYWICPILFPPLVYLYQIMQSPKAAHWWRSQSSFYPPAILNVISVISYQCCAVSGKFLARYVLDRPIYSTSSYHWADFLILVLSLLFLDFVAYFVHRLQHHPSVYTNYHSIHHRVKYVSIWASFYAHPFDYLSTALPLPLLIHSVLPIHYYNDILTAIISTLSLVTIHSDYQSLNNGHHVIHHLEPRCNFSGSSPWMDQLFGTLVTPEQLNKRRKEE